jgi:hypothetical protein
MKNGTSGALRHPEDDEGHARSQLRLEPSWHRAAPVAPKLAAAAAAAASEARPGAGAAELVREQQVPAPAGPAAAHPSLPPPSPLLLLPPAGEVPELPEGQGEGGDGEELHGGSLVRRHRVSHVRHKDLAA